MKTSLDHLPAGKRRELELVVEILTTSFAKAIAGRNAERLRNGKILKIILFGSYARGDWVEDPVGRYFSDYDLLVVVDHEDLTDTIEFWEDAEKRLLAELSSGQRLRTPVNFIVHSLDDVNHQLERGRYFFIDVLRDGITLHDTPDAFFAKPQPLAPATALAEAEGYYLECIEGADSASMGANFYKEAGKYRDAAFLLHQQAERLYNGLLLVLTFYTPKAHNLVRLRGLAEAIDPTLSATWPTDTKFQKRCFELLRAAYVKARYSRHYKITDEELAWIQARLAVLGERVRALCEQRIAALRSA